MDQKPSGEELATKPLKPGRVALNVLALCFALSVLGRGLGESFTVFLKPISEDFGWDRTADRPAVRPFRATHGLCARGRPARRRIPVRVACASAVAVPAQHRALR